MASPVGNGVAHIRIKKLKFIYVKAPLHINSHTKFQLGFSKFQFCNGQNGQEGGTASLCQILLKSLQLRPRYRDFSIFQDGGCRHVGFLKLQFLTFEKVKKVEVHQWSKFRRNRLNCGRDMVILRFPSLFNRPLPNLVSI